MRATEAGLPDNIRLAYDGLAGKLVREGLPSAQKILGSFLTRIFVDSNLDSLGLAELAEVTEFLIAVVEQLFDALLFELFE